MDNTRGRSSFAVERLVGRVHSSVAALGCTPAEALALLVLATGAVAVVAVLWFIGRPEALPAAAAPALAALTAETADSASPSPSAGAAGGTAPDVGATGEPETPLVVHVAGQVTAPGLYELPSGSRVDDALMAAGGPLPDGVLDGLNLARPLEDGEQIRVPAPGEPAALAVPAAPSAPAAGDGEQVVDLNTASASELETLPGVGPVLAERIIEYREQIGGFVEPGQLREVPGIGEKTFQSMVERVRV